MIAQDLSHATYKLAQPPGAGGGGEDRGPWGFRARHLLRLPWGAQVTTMATFLLPVLATPTLAVFSRLQALVA